MHVYLLSYCLTVDQEASQTGEDRRAGPKQPPLHPSEEHAEKMTQILCQLPADTSAAPSSRQLQTWRPIPAPDDAPASSASRRSTLQLLSPPAAGA